MKYPLKFLVIAGLVLQALSVYAQEKVNFWDSLEHSVSTIAPDTSTVLRLNELFRHYSGNGRKKALPYAERARQLADSLQYPRGLALSTLHLAIAYDMQGNYSTALQYYQQALRLSTQLGLDDYRSSCLLSLGYFYNTQGNYAKAIETTRESAMLEESMNSLNNAALGWSNLGYYYLKSHKYDSALFYTLKSYEIFKTRKDSAGLGDVFFNLGAIAWESDSNAFKALNYCLKAQEMYLGSTHKEIEALTECRLQIGFLYLQLKNYHMAGSYLHKVFEQAEANNLRYILKNAYKHKSSLYAAVGEFKKAYDMYNQFFQLHDSLHNYRSTLTLKQLQAEYELETQEAKIALLNKDQIIKQDELELQLIIRNGFISMFGLLLVFASVLFHNNRQKQKSNKLLIRQKEEIEKKSKAILRKNDMLQEQKQAMLLQSRNLHAANLQVSRQKATIEQKNKDIIDSLNYARGMQYAMLPQAEQLKDKLPDAFVWLQPRDIVSGDFFWYDELENKLFIAAIDCTGHGVPGAFMSLIADSYLRQLVRSERIFAPELLLDRLRTYVPRVLHQATTENQDGMDIGLCIVDLEQEELQFAGARTNLFYVQNERLYKIKGDRISIGGQVGKKNASFRSHTVKFNRTTRFYLYTDGLKDQFGGPDDKKFGEARINSLLLEVHHLPMSKQRMLIKERMEKWMEGYEQIDDILILGWSLP